jgi:hypothetical protein
MTNLVGETDDPALSGVYGKNTGQGGVGVTGISESNDGVRAVSTSGNGLSAFTSGGSATAVYGKNTGQGGVGVTGISESNDGVRAISTSGNGLSAFTSGSGTAIYAQNDGSGAAGFFKGNVVVTGDIQLTALTGSDCAERFDIAGSDQCDPGTVMVMEHTGVLIPSWSEYDRRVAGVVSGAGGLRPGVILEGQPGTGRRLPIALIGKVYCKVVADDSPIEVGDLLTTSGILGHAMKATDPSRAFGAVIGKAIDPLAKGRGLIRILVALQ